jgi:hypothetical protein
MHWSAMLTKEFAKLVVDDGGGSHRRGLRIKRNCRAARVFGVVLELEVLEEVVLALDDCEQSEVWMIEKV